MRSEFEKLFTAQRSYRSSDKEAFIRGCEAAYQHQQSKVDELQKQKSLQELEINQIAQANQQWQLKCDELQKRVDSTLKVVQSMRNEVKHGHMSDEEVQMLSSFADELEQALKGESNESST